MNHYLAWDWCTFIAKTLFPWVKIMQTMCTFYKIRFAPTSSGDWIIFGRKKRHHACQKTWSLPHVIYIQCNLWQFLLLPISESFFFLMKIFYLSFKSPCNLCFSLDQGCWFVIIWNFLSRDMKLWSCVFVPEDIWQYLSVLEWCH